jgi:ribose/xylose/arabinose/galactoside ABC-type transport system permease subunit
MGEMSPTSGRIPQASFESSSDENYRDTSNFTWTLILLILVGVASLILGEQLITGWLALGERANISRRDINVIEVVSIIGCVAWTLVTLRTAWGFLRHEHFVSMDLYFSDKHSRRAPGVFLTILLLGIFGILSFFLAEQVLTGWLALGERANISRRDLNAIEWLVVVGGIVWGIVSLRTVLGLWQRDRRAWAWAQWVVLINAVIGLGLFMSGLTDLYSVVPRGGTIIDNLPAAQELVGPGSLLLLSSLVVYRFLTVRVHNSATGAIRNSLSSVPGAGAIVGFFAILMLFSISSDLFLEPRSIASILATAITRGIVAIGITFLMISGEFDLSVGSTYGAGALVFLLMMTEGALGIAPVSVIPAAIIALVFAGFLGFINGLILIKTGIPSFIVTLGTLLAYRAILLVVVADGRILRYADYRLPPPNVWFNRWILGLGALVLAVAIGYMGITLVRSGWRALRGRIQNYRNDLSDFRDVFVVLTALRFLLVLVIAVGAVALLLTTAIDQLSQTNTLLEVSFFDLMNGRFDFVDRDVNLRSGVMWWLILVVVFQFILTQTRYGNHVFAVGGNPGAARAQGINVNRVKVTNFIICAMLACLAGIINVSRLSNVDPLMGDGLELEVIAASVIGGALLSGGYGSIFGALLGVLIFGMLQTGLVLVGVDARAFSGVIGIIIILAVIINTAVRRVRT